MAEHLDFAAVLVDQTHPMDMTDSKIDLKKMVTAVQGNLIWR